MDNKLSKQVDVLQGKMIEMVGSLKFWAATFVAVLFVLKLIVAHTFSLETLIPVLEGWGIAIFGIRLFTDLNAKK